MRAELDMGIADNISDAEWVVMQVLWDLKQATAGEVIARLAGTNDWNHRTVRTLIRRLVDKGLVACEVDGQRYLYRPAVSRQACVRDEGRSFVKRVFCGDVSSLLIHFAREAGLDQEKLRELRNLLDDDQDAGAGRENDHA
jgi:BlaI family transcriptional regulator, penicillinase repressor